MLSNNNIHILTDNEVTSVRLFPRGTMSDQKSDRPREIGPSFGHSQARGGIDVCIHLSVTTCMCFITQHGLKCEIIQKSGKERKFCSCSSRFKAREGAVIGHYLQRLVPARVLVPAKHARAITRLY